jgi:hypothetical protein
VIEPLRGAAVVFGATRKVTPPLPLLFGPAPAVMLIQDELLTAVQTQPVGMVTDTTRDPPGASNDSFVDDTLAVHSAAACVTFSRRPPIAIVPLRDVPAGLASTRYVVLPLPVPEAPVRIEIHETLGTADHPQPPGTVMFTLPLPPAAAMFWLAGFSEASHAAPAWVITNGWPATVTVVDRELLSGLAATEYPALPLPVPPGAPNVTQDTGLCAVHEHVRPAVTLTLPDPADAVSEALAGEML